MYKKLTISMEPQVYEGLKRVIGAGRISAFLNEIAKPFVDKKSIGAAYQEMAADESREKEAGEWVENLASGVKDEEG